MKKIFINMMILSSIAFTGCNDSFLDKTPVTELTEETAFNSYDNFKAFMWPCYEMFTNTTIRTSIASGSAWGAGIILVMWMQVTSKKIMWPVIMSLPIR